MFIQGVLTETSDEHKAFHISLERSWKDQDVANRERMGYKYNTVKAEGDDVFVQEMITTVAKLLWEGVWRLWHRQWR